MNKWRRSLSWLLLLLVPSILVIASETVEVVDQHHDSPAELDAIPAVEKDLHRGLKWKGNYYNYGYGGGMKSMMWGGMKSMKHKDLFVQAKGYKGYKGNKGYKGKVYVAKGKGGVWKKMTWKKKPWYKGKGKGYYKGYWKGKGWKGKGYKGWKGHHQTKSPTMPPSPTTPAPNTPPGPTPAPQLDPTPSPLPPGVTASPTIDCSTCRTECIGITDWALVDANRDLADTTPEAAEADYLEIISEGQVFSLSELRARHGTNDFALVCVTDPRPFDTREGWEIGSVGLRDENHRTHEGTAGFNGNLDYNGESSAPYTLADDNSGNYNPTDWTIGYTSGNPEWRITCQAFCDNSLRGEESVPRTRTFIMNE